MHSKSTARIMSYGSMHELQEIGGQEKDLWRLFEVMMFGYEQSKPSTYLLGIGQEIGEQCANVTLAIRVVGNLLYGQGKCE